MATVKPFKGWRPPKDLVTKVSSRPYDVLDTEEARKESEGNPMSLYHIIRPEINFPAGKDEHDPEVYTAAREQKDKFVKEGWLVQDEKPCYYLYAQTMGDRTQYGFVVGAYVHDYFNNVIRKHELTLRAKEDDRMKHVNVLNANMEPVFLAFPDNADLQAIIDKYRKTEPEYDFVAPPEDFRHTFWVISDDRDIETITREFGKMPALYIADGHHRSAAAARVGKERSEVNPNHTGKEEYNYFMAVAFPASHLHVMDYNRVVKDLNGLTKEQFIKKLEENFDVECKGKEIYHPNKLHNFSMYLDGQWYSLTAKPGTYDDNDPVGILDVTVSSNLILEDILKIGDLRTSNRIDFVGGLRGLEELQRRVDSGEMIMALALYPVTMGQIMKIADTGNIMPPKATWFEPKLRSGLIAHTLEDEK